MRRTNLRASHSRLSRLTVTANVANTYFSVLALRARIAIANENIAAINGILDTINLRVSTGKSSHLDLAQEQAQVESVEAQLPMLEQQELEARVALAVLLGRTARRVRSQDAEPWTRFIYPLHGRDFLLNYCCGGRMSRRRKPIWLLLMPISMLRARPSCRNSRSPGMVASPVRPSTHFFMVPILPGTSVRISCKRSSTAANWWDRKNLAQATQRQLIASYQGAVLNAYADVENALGQVANNSKAEIHLAREVEAASEAFKISQLQYRQGVTELLTVLQAQQTLFAAEDQLAQTTLAHMQAVVHLFEALGGGWVEPPDERTQFAATDSG